MTIRKFKILHIRFSSSPQLHLHTCERCIQQRNQDSFVSVMGNVRLLHNT